MRTNATCEHLRARQDYAVQELLLLTRQARRYLRHPEGDAQIAELPATRLLTLNVVLVNGVGWRRVEEECRERVVGTHVSQMHLQRVDLRLVELRQRGSRIANDRLESFVEPFAEVKLHGLLGKLERASRITQHLDGLDAARIVEKPSAAGVALHQLAL